MLFDSWLRTVVGKVLQEGVVRCEPIRWLLSRRRVKIEEIRTDGVESTARSRPVVRQRAHGLDQRQRLYL